VLSTDPDLINRLLDEPQHVHVVAIAGAGMSAIAGVLVEMGHLVSGSDLKTNSATDRLASLGARINVGHDAANVTGATLVTASRAVSDDNPELIAATNAGCVVATRTDMLTALSRRKQTLAVSGTHGKTTTTSLLSLVMRHGQRDPSFIIGGMLADEGIDSHWSRDSPWLVIEADESDGTFAKLRRAGAIITNLEPDHLEQFGDWSGYQNAFIDFAANTQGPVVVCLDDHAISTIRDQLGDQVVTYGTHADADFCIVEIHRISRNAQRFSVRDPHGTIHSGVLNVGGAHNVLNAVAAIALANYVAGVPVDTGVDAVAKFGGVKRRFTYRAEIDGITLVDDYAHLPTEVRAALSIAIGGGWQRVVAVLQPHRYSRISIMADEFGDSVGGVDLVVVTDVYGAHETPIAGVDGMMVVNAIAKHHPELRVVYTPTKADAVDFLATELTPGDVCVTLGCGDITVLHDLLGPRLATARGVTL
jgi:UDP-N-acetylmuramate--alanine ligase